MSASPDDHLNDALADYMQRVDRGDAVDREAFLAEYADVARELRAYFDDADLVERMAGPRAGETLPSPGATVADVPPLAKIRYFGDYELTEEIARGGMGVVYKARQVSLNRTVALKMILAGQLASEADVRRFHAEAEAAANLDHPGIVPIFEIGEHDGQHYFSMAYVEGTSLAAKIAEGPLPPREAAALLKQVAEAVHYAHEQGVIHRDLKPANVLIDKQDNARVTDFGLAKRVQSASDLTGTGQILGTPSYMPPEQAAGKTEEVRETADVYALGAVLYAMLTGRPPFQSDNPVDTLLQVKEREPVAPRQLNPKIPIDLETICLKCLEKSPRRRYESAAVLSAELGRFLRNEPVRARPISAFSRWSRSNVQWHLSGPQLVVASGVGTMFLGMLKQGFTDEFGITAVSTVLESGIGVIFGWAMLGVCLLTSTERYRSIVVTALAMLGVFRLLYHAATTKGSLGLEYFDKMQLLCLSAGLALWIAGGVMGLIRQRHIDKCATHDTGDAWKVLLLGCVMEAALVTPVKISDSYSGLRFDEAHDSAAMLIHILLLAAVFLAGFGAIRAAWFIFWAAIGIMSAMCMSDWESDPYHAMFPLVVVAIGGFIIVIWSLVQSKARSIKSKWKRETSGSGGCLVLTDSSLELVTLRSRAGLQHVVLRRIVSAISIFAAVYLALTSVNSSNPFYEASILNSTHHHQRLVILYAKVLAMSSLASLPGLLFYLAWRLLPEKPRSPRRYRFEMSMGTDIRK